MGNRWGVEAVDIVEVQDVAGLADAFIRDDLGPGYEMACHGVRQPQKGNDEPQFERERVQPTEEDVRLKKQVLNFQFILCRK